MIVEDYASCYYEAQAGRQTPVTYEGKFVHIVGPQEEFLVLSPVELAEYHSHIVQRFSRRRHDISSIASPSGNEVRFGTPGWKIKGGGRFRLERDAEILHLWGSSRIYGRFDGSHLRHALKSTAGWEHFAIRLAEPD